MDAPPLGSERGGQEKPGLGLGAELLDQGEKEPGTLIPSHKTLGPHSFGLPTFLGNSATRGPRAWAG